MTLSELNDLIANQCPIAGINSDGVIAFLPEATKNQRLSAQALIDQFLPGLMEHDALGEFRQQAQLALDKSDMTIIRCIENGVAIPQAWVAYRASLRIFIKSTSGDPTQSLPTRPDYPAGT